MAVVGERRERRSMLLTILWILDIMLGLACVVVSITFFSSHPLAAAVPDAAQSRAAEVAQEQGSPVTEEQYAAILAEAGDAGNALEKTTAWLHAAMALIWFGLGLTGFLRRYTAAVALGAAAELTGLTALALLRVWVYWIFVGAAVVTLYVAWGLRRGAAAGRQDAGRGERILRGHL